MKSVFFLIIVFCITQLSLAQTKPKPKTTAKPPIEKPTAYILTKADTAFLSIVTGSFCNCMQPIADSLHEVMLVFVEDASVIGEEKATAKMQKIVDTLNEIEYVKFQNSQKYFSNEKNGYLKQATKCDEDLDKKFNLYDKNINKNTKKYEAFEKIIFYFLGLRCKKVSRIVKAGEIIKE